MSELFKAQNYRYKSLNSLPEGVHWSSMSKKWVARAKDHKGNLTSVGQHADKTVADKIYEEYIAKY